MNRLIRFDHAAVIFNRVHRGGLASLRCATFPLNFRFSLRTMLVVVKAVGVLLGTTSHYFGAEFAPFGGGVAYDQFGCAVQ
jgi:hypothetical protein